MKLNDKVLDKVTGGENTTTQRTAGLTCPRCGNFIPTTIEMIIKGKVLVCESCGLTLPIDKMSGTSAIDALRKVKEAQDALERKQQEQ